MTLSVAVAFAAAAPVALAGSTALVVPTSAGLWRGLVDPPGLARLSAAALAGGLVAWLTRRWPPSLRTPILAMALAVVPLVPVFTGRLLFLLVFQERVLRLVAVAALAVLLVRALSLRHPAAPRIPGWALALAAFLLYAAFGTHVPGKQRLEGDEPHYLLMAHSLVHDGDLDLSNQYGEQQYWPFYGDVLQPHVSAASRPGTAYSTHAPGLPALIAPAYALFGPRGVRLFLSLLVAIAGALVHAAVREASRDEWVALAAWAIVALTPPLPIFAVAVYPETVVACAVALLLFLRRGEPGAVRALLAGLLAGALLWLHPKNLVLGGVALVLVLARLRRRSLQAAAIACFVLGAATFLFYMRVTFGHATLSAGFGTPDLSLAQLPWGGLATLFDRQWGLFAIAPVWALAAAAAVQRVRSEKAETLGLVALAAAPIVVGGAFTDWSGGHCPPARYPLPAIPPLALLLAPALARRRGLAALLAGAGLGVLLLAVEVPGVLRNPVLGEANLLRALTTFDLNSVFPSFFDRGSATPVLLSVSAAVALGLAWRLGGRGFAAGALGYLLLASALRDGPPVDPHLTTRLAIETWDRGTRIEPTGALELGRLSLPIELPGAPWALPKGESLRTRPLDLPPGAYSLSARWRPDGSRSELELELRAGSVHLGAQTLRAEGESSFPLLLPVGAHALVVSCNAKRGGTVLEGLDVVPAAVVARRERGALEWWRFLDDERYRLPRGLLRLTLLEGAEPADGEAVRLTGAPARLVIDGPQTAVVSLNVVRAEARAADAFTWGRRRAALGSQRELTLRLSMAEGVPFGAGRAVVAVRMDAPGARLLVSDGLGAAETAP